VLGDAQIELGAYNDAAQTYGRLYSDAPDSAAVLVREARIAFLLGGVDRAERLAKEAKDKAMASAFGDAGLAFYTTFEAQLAHDTGHYDRAANLYQQALREAPGYYIALAGLGREQAALGHIDDAIATYEQAVAVVPQPDAVAALADLYHLRGDNAKAKTEYDTVGVIATLAAINKQVYNRALAVYDADHDVNVTEAVRLAQTELAVRQDVYGYDTYAWALYKGGQFALARDAAAKALAQGTPDAKLLYHAGLIDKALGNESVAHDELSRALKINPKFDPVQAPVAVAALAEIDHGVVGVHS
jgi:tetratricopeptide (TPR) repeat protein